MQSHLPLGHQVRRDGHVLEEDGQVESVVTFSVCHGGIGPVSQQLDHHGEVALPPHAQRPHAALRRRRTRHPRLVFDDRQHVRSCALGHIYLMAQ